MVEQNPALDALKAISRARMAIQDAEARGLNTSKATDMLGQAQKFLAKLDYTRAMEMARNIPGSFGSSIYTEPRATPPPGQTIISPNRPTPPPTPANPLEALKAGTMSVDPQHPATLNKYAGIVGIGKSPPTARATATPATRVPRPPPALPPAKNALPNLRPKVNREYLRIHTGNDAERVLSSCERMHYLRMEREKGVPVFPLQSADRLTKMPFTHGIEMELMVVKRNGEWIEGTILENHFTYIIEYARKILRQIVDRAPELIRTKILRVWTQNINEINHIRGRVVMLSYRLGDGDIEIELIGRDPHGVGVTWLLEAVTPPCEYVEELEWWINTLKQICHRAVLEVAASFFSGELIKMHPDLKFEEFDLALASGGLNPVNKFVTGISFGDHHHIGIPDPDLRLEIYNMLRNFLPHLIALSVNSPFESSRVPDIKMTKNRIVSAPLSHRLASNEGQLCSGEAATHIPHLPPGSTVDDFVEHVQKSDEQSARLVEMFPFTKFSTVEVRVFDGQLTTMDRIGMALLIQALALKTKRMKDSGKSVPEVSAVSLVENRKRAVKKGALLGFKKDPDLPTKDLDFARIYQERIAETDFTRNVSRISHALSNLIYFVKDELREMKALESGYMDNILLSIFGGSRFKVNPPLSQAQYQLYLFNKECDSNFNKLDASSVSLIEALTGITSRIAATGRYNPMVEEFGTPLTPAFMQERDIKVDLFTRSENFAVGPRPVSITITNPSDEILEQVEVISKAFDAAGKEVMVRSFPIGNMAPKDERFATLPLEMDGISPYYTVHAEVYMKDSGSRRMIAHFVRNVTRELFFTQIAYIGEEGCKIEGPTLIPFLVKSKYNSSGRMDFKARVELVEVNTDNLVQSTEFDMETLMSKEYIWAPSTNMIKENIVRLLMEMPHQTVFIQPVKRDRFVILPAKCRFELKIFDTRGTVVTISRSKEFMLT